MIRTQCQYSSARHQRENERIFSSQSQKGWQKNISLLFCLLITMRHFFLNDRKQRTHFDPPRVRRRTEHFKTRVRKASSLEFKDHHFSDSNRGQCQCPQISEFSAGQVLHGLAQSVGENGDILEQLLGRSSVFTVMEMICNDRRQM